MKTESSEKHGGRRGWTRARGIVMGAIWLFIVASLVWHTGGGSLSALGVGQIAAVCPLGILEAALGGRGIAVHSIALLAAVVVLTVVFGKAFCSWACPTKVLQNFFRGKRKDGAVEENAGEADAQGGEENAAASSAKPLTADERDSLHAACGAEAKTASGCAACAALGKVGGKRDGLRVDGRHVVLGGALVSALAFGFPVFCLVCPVGLSVATFIGVWHLIQFNETTWGLVVFPVILVLELVVFRKWCTKLCPVSALLSLVSSLNRTFKPVVDESKCLRSSGVDCRTCVTVCPEQVDPHSKSIPECSKCGKCVEQCPAQAISMKALAKHGPSETPASASSRIPAERP